MIVERDVVDVYRTIYMQDHIGDEFEGRISGFAPFGIYVQVEDPYVSVLLPFEQLDDSFEPDDLGIRLVGARTSKVYTMSDLVRVRIEDANVQARDVVGSIVEHWPAEAPTQARTSQRRPTRRRRGAAKKDNGQPGKSQKRTRRRR